MTKQIDRLLGRARKLETAIADKVQEAARKAAGPTAAEPLEIVLAIVETVEREIQPAGRGRHAFPFNQVRVSIAATSPRAKAQLATICDGPPSLHERIADRLRLAGCPVADLSVKTSFVTKDRPEWGSRGFHVSCLRTAVSDGGHAGARLDMTVTNGAAEQASYSFGSETISIGRGAEVRDTRQRLIRINQVAFVESGGDVNTSVSRRHARIEHDAASGAYRVFDDGSAQGTHVIRRGRGIAVPRGTKGMVLFSGDVLVMGQARVAVTIQPR